MRPLSYWQLKGYYTLNCTKERKNSEHNTLLLVGLIVNTENHYNLFKSTNCLPLKMNEQMGVVIYKSYNK